MGCGNPSASNRVIVVQPMGSIKPELANNVHAAIKVIHPHTVLRPPCPIPQQAWYAPRNRYRADSIIAWLHRRTGPDTITIGLTDKDISTTKGQVADWGVMGLGYRPGNACMVSTFRLSKSKTKSQFYKVALHELGHTAGLPHCPDTNCYMRDAEGGNPLDTETGFCYKCKTYMKGKGWLMK